MPYRDSLFWTAIVYYAPSLILTAALAWIAFTYILVAPSQAAERATTIGVHLSASSILFGFVSFLLRSSVQDTEVLNQKTADIAKELSTMYKKVRADNQLSAKQFSYRTKLDDYGKDSAFGVSGEGSKVIQSAFNFLGGPFRSWVRLTRRIIYLFYVTSLLFLGSAIILFLASDSLANPSPLIDVGSFLLVLSLPSIVMGAYLSNRDLSTLNDTLLNIQLQFNSQFMEMPPVAKETADVLRQD